MSSLKQLRILLVEDNAIALQVHKEIIQEIIKEINGRLDTVETGEEALLKASTNQYDVIFMDIGLPDVDGIEITSKIRESESSESKEAVIIGLTGFDLDDVQAECLAAGMNKVIQKPVPFAVLQYLIRSYKC